MPYSQESRLTALTPAGVQALAARNLELLTAIENTIDALAADTRILGAIHEAYTEVLDRLDGGLCAIDPAGRAQATLQKSSDACARIHDDARLRYRSARADPNLHPDDGVAEAYQAFIEVVRALHDAIEALRERIATHDAVLEPAASRVFTDVDELFADMIPGA